MNEISGLPPRAHLKISALEDDEQRALTLSTSTTRKISELHHALALNSNSPHADVMRLEIERLEVLQRKYQDQHRQRADLNAKVRHFLAMLPADATLADAKPIKPKLRDGETHLTALERIRHEIAGVASERLNVEQAGLPLSELKKRTKEWVKERGAHGRPTITANHDKFEVIFLDPAAYSTHPDIPSILAWFDPQGMEVRLNQLIDGMPTPKLALTPAEKAERLRELKLSVLSLERQEEAIIVSAEEAGQTIPRRINASPAAILNLTIDRAKATAA